MSDYWSDRSAAAANLRLLTRDGKWLAWDDRDADPEDATSRRAAGAKARVEDALSQALHSTNIVALLGSGASYCAKNATDKRAPGMADLWFAAREKVCEGNLLGYGDFETVVIDVIGSIPTEGKAGDIESLLSLCKMQLELLEARAKNKKLPLAIPSPASSGDPVTILKNFIDDAESAILDKVDFVDNATSLPAHKALIQKLAKRAVEKPRVRLFTTNYDLCLEEAAARLGVVLIDGFSHSAEQRFNRDYFQHDIVRRATSGTKADYIDGVFHLYKLHGSVDWRRKNDGVVIRSRESDRERLKPVLIYPRSTKYQEAFEVPYLDMFAAFQAALREPDTTLIVAGFGFADDHISAPIWSALESNLSLRLILVDPSFVPAIRLDAIGAAGDLIELEIGVQRPYQKRIMRLVEEGDTRITILNGRFDDLVDAMPMITGESDRQRLQMRLDQIRDTP